jgi:L-aspartate semialdehyde sulfurtransferase ferredoxin
MRRRYRLTYPAALLSQPLIYRLIKQFDVVTNIIHAQVEKESGWLVVEMEATDTVLAAATGWLTEQGVKVEEIEKP